MGTAEVPQPRPRPTRIATLKSRPEFLRIRKGARFASPGFVLEAKRREDAGLGADGARFGFTVSKKVGNAVERNRVKRRLKAAVRDLVRDHARNDFDYVLIARRAALDAVFATLTSNLITAFGRVHAKPGDGQKGQAQRRDRLRGS